MKLGEPCPVCQTPAGQECGCSEVRDGASQEQIDAARTGMYAAMIAAYSRKVVARAPVPFSPEVVAELTEIFSGGDDATG